MITRTIGRDLPDRSYIEIECALRDGGDGLSPGYAVSALLWKKSGTWTGRTCKRKGRDANAAGQLLTEIRAVAPELEPLLLTHLADPDGVPLHARANGWYFYTGAATKYEREHYGEEYATRYGTPHERAAHALHIPTADLPHDMDRAAFEAFCDTLTDRWAEQAAAARAVLDSLTDGDGVEDA